MADIQRLLDSMATTPDIYFCDAWEDALMGDVLRYLVTKMSGCWSPAADRVISMLPWSVFALETIEADFVG